jgi:hypothetical protein
MKKFLESLLGSCVFLGFFWLPLSDLYHEYGALVIAGMVAFILVTAPLLHDFCERNPYPLRTRDCLRRLFRWGHFFMIELFMEPHHVCSRIQSIRAARSRAT